MTTRGSGPNTSSTRRHARATRPRKKSDLAGPMREVVYIFEREGARGGGYWWLVLSCGHTVARKRCVAKHWTAMVHLMFRPLSEKLAPKRVHVSLVRRWPREARSGGHDQAVRRRGDVNVPHKQPRLEYRRFRRRRKNVPAINT